MNKIFKNKRILFLLVASLLIPTVFLVMKAGQTKAVYFTPINSQLYVGSRGQDVTNLQTFLASDKNIYPEGLITGYYGPLTTKAVAQFQIAYGIQSVGWVGPQTLTKINEVINAGRGIDIYAPTIYNPSVSKTNTSASFSWSTNENALGKVFFSTTPFYLAEATGMFTGPTISNGFVMTANNYAMSQNITVSGLSPNTTYYYIIESIDESNNVTVTNTSTLITSY